MHREALKVNERMARASEAAAKWSMGAAIGTGLAAVVALVSVLIQCASTPKIVAEQPTAAAAVEVPACFDAGPSK
jgi:F0F1-type ATP synthase membrane subunit c/vacuolar-type H+-ATPase subunit K